MAYHLVFDNTFSTVHSDGQFTADVWDSLVASNVERHIDCETTFSGDPTVSETEFPVSRDLQREILPTVSPGATTNTDSVPVPVPSSSEIDSELHRMFQRLNAPTASVPVPASVPNSDLPSSLLSVPPMLTSPLSISEGATPSVSEGDTLPSLPAPR